jgi:ferredoxin--NADP+ reductase
MDLIVVGGSAQALAVAMQATRGGLTVRILTAEDNVSFPQVVGREQLDIGYGETVAHITTTSDGVRVKTDKGEYEACACVVAQHQPHSFDIGSIATGPHVHNGSEPETVRNKDVLVVGQDERAIEIASRYIDEGARAVVLAAKGMNPDSLPRPARERVAELEQNRQITVLFRSSPESITTENGSEPFVEFGAAPKGFPPMPELVFDEVVFVEPFTNNSLNEFGEEVAQSDRVVFTHSGVKNSEETTNYREALVKLAPVLPNLNLDEIQKINSRPREYLNVPAQLRDALYNAEITYFEKAHSDLWVIRVRPDTGDIDHKPGQYATLALGYWEERVGEGVEPDIDDHWDDLIRRNYSISNRIFTDEGYLASETENGELEFYIVLVPGQQGHLTPRLALKNVGDRIFMGQKMAGLYTLEAVTDPNHTVVFLSTGTGEAPHNSMIVELLRRGHKGKIISAVNVRQQADLGYYDKNVQLAGMFDNYTYLPLPTREPGVEKRYILDTINSGELEETLGAPIEPDNTHVYLCGNPLMIGAPDREGNLPKEPAVVGTLVERGLTIARHRVPGNIHFESFWKD